MQYLTAAINVGFEIITSFLPGDEEDENILPQPHHPPHHHHHKDDNHAELTALEEEIVEENEDEDEDPDDFDPDFTVGLFSNSWDRQTKDVNAIDFINGCRQVPKLMSGMGNTMKMGNKKLWEKINWMERRLKEAAADLKQDVNTVTLQQMIERDIKNKWTHTGKPTNHATRNIIRLVWFVDFLRELFFRVADVDPNKNLKNVLIATFKNSLGKHQGMLIRNATIAGINVSPVPTRAAFSTQLGFDDLTVDQQNGKMKKWGEDMDELSKVMWAYLKSKKLMKVP